MGIAILAKRLIQTLWASFGTPLSEWKGDLWILLAGLLYVVFKARSLREISYGELIELAAPLAWTLCALFSWHVMKAASSNLAQTQGIAQGLGVATLAILLLGIPIWIVLLTWPSADPNSPRTLSQKQKESLIAALIRYKGQRYAMDYARNSQEVMEFAASVDEAFNGSDWVKLSYPPMYDPIGFPEAFRLRNQFGVQWYIADRPKPTNPAAKALRTALNNCCNLTADGVRMPDERKQMEDDVIYIYIGPKFIPKN